MPADSSFTDLAVLTGRPASVNVSQEGRLVIQAPPLVDWWRSPEPVAVNRKDGVFFGREVDPSRPFKCGLWIRATLDALYDQGCLVVHGGDLDDEQAHWLKAGTETFDDKEWVNAVVCAPWSDVSAVNAPRPLSTTADGAWIYLELTKERSITGHTILIKWAARSKPDLTNLPVEDLYNLREVQAFGVDSSGKRTNPKRWYVGPMVSGLSNEVGARAEFEGFWLRYLD